MAGAAGWASLWAVAGFAIVRRRTRGRRAISRVRPESPPPAPGRYDADPPAAGRHPAQGPATTTQP